MASRFNRGLTAVKRLSPWRQAVEKHTGPLSDEMYAAVKRVKATVPREHREMFDKEFLPLHLAAFPTPRQFEESWRIINSHFVPLMVNNSPYSRLLFYKEALPLYFNGYKDAKTLNEALRVVVNKLLPAIAGSRSSFFVSDLPRVLRHAPSPAALEAIAELAREMHRDQQSDLLRKALPEYLEKHKPSDKEIQQQVQIAKGYLKDKDYFYSRVIAENFGRLAPQTQIVNRLKFYKEPVLGSPDNPQFFESKVIPLGGKLIGHIIRILHKSAYEAWLAAHKAGVPVEEILHKNGKPRAYAVGKDGVRVYTRYAGQRVDDFLEKYPKHRTEIGKQMGSILKRLEELGITYSWTPTHFHEGNFTVEMANGKPIVRIIDFDMAELRETK